MGTASAIAFRDITLNKADVLNWGKGVLMMQHTEVQKASFEETSQHQKQLTYNLPVLDARPKSLVYYASKRAFDLVGASILLLLLMPLMVCLWIAIRSTSKGPAIFVQQRVSVRLEKQGGRYVWVAYPFAFHKFRSMYHKADEDLHRKFVQAMIRDDTQMMKALQGEDDSQECPYKLHHDPRVTPLGAFLRKTSLDELPQLWDVVVGHMSLVGPRPAIPYEVEVYSPQHLRRLGAKPGITGLWQVKARSEVSFDHLAEIDAEYIKQQSFLLDLKLLVLTPIIILFRRGAM